MKINNDISNLMELKLVVPNRQLAKYLYKSWVDKAAEVFAHLHELLLD
jgi:hypothetical protein